MNWKGKEFSRKYLVNGCQRKKSSKKDNELKLGSRIIGCPLVCYLVTTHITNKTLTAFKIWKPFENVHFKITIFTSKTTQFPFPREKTLIFNKVLMLIVDPTQYFFWSSLSSSLRTFCCQQRLSRLSSNKITVSASYVENVNEIRWSHIWIFLCCLMYTCSLVVLLVVRRIYWHLI